MGLFSKKDTGACPYVGEVDEAGETSLWQCRFPNRRSTHCLITNPNEWEDKCNYVLETKAALDGRQIEVSKEREAQQPLVSQAKSFIDNRLGRPTPIRDQATPSALRDKTYEGHSYQPKHLPDAKRLLLTRAHPATHDSAVLFYYLTPEDFDALLDLLDGAAD